MDLEGESVGGDPGAAGWEGDGGDLCGVILRMDWGKNMLAYYFSALTIWRETSSRRLYAGKGNLPKPARAMRPDVTVDKRILRCFFKPEKIKHRVLGQAQTARFGKRLHPEERSKRSARQSK